MKPTLSEFSIVPVRGNGREYFEVLADDRVIDSFYYRQQAEQLVEALHSQRAREEFALRN